MKSSWNGRLWYIDVESDVRALDENEGEANDSLHETIDVFLSLVTCKCACGI